MKQLLTIAFLLLLASCGQSLDTETVERCLNGDCSDVTLAEEADTNDDQEIRLTESEKRILCLEGQWEMCDTSNPFKSVEINAIVNLNIRYGFTVVETMRGNRNEVTVIQGVFFGNAHTGNFRTRHEFEINEYGDVRKLEKLVGTEYANPNNVGRIKRTTELSTGELELDQGKWYMIMSDGEEISLDF